MSGVTLLVGITLLLFGRRLFWLFVAGVGFLAGAWLAVEYLKVQPDSLALAVAIGLGIVGAMIAFWAQKVAVGLGGFLAGSILGHAVGMAVQSNVPVWVFAVAGGVLGAILLAVLFDWALIALSSLLGAAVIAQNASLVPPWPVVLFVLLLGVGLAIQSRQFSRRRVAAKNKEPQKE